MRISRLDPFEFISNEKNIPERTFGFLRQNPFKEQYNLPISSDLEHHIGCAAITGGGKDLLFQGLLEADWHNKKNIVVLDQKAEYLFLCLPGINPKFRKIQKKKKIKPKEFPITVYLPVNNKYTRWKNKYKLTKILPNLVKKDHLKFVQFKINPKNLNSYDALQFIASIGSKWQNMLVFRAIQTAIETERDDIGTILNDLIEGDNAIADRRSKSVQGRLDISQDQSCIILNRNDLPKDSVILDFDELLTYDNRIKVITGNYADFEDAVETNFYAAIVSEILSRVKSAKKKYDPTTLYFPELWLFIRDNPPNHEADAVNALKSKLAKFVRTSRSGGAWFRGNTQGVEDIKGSGVFGQCQNIFIGRTKSYKSKLYFKNVMGFSNSLINVLDQLPVGVFYSTLTKQFFEARGPSSWKASEQDNFVETVYKVNELKINEFEHEEW